MPSFAQDALGFKVTAEQWERIQIHHDLLQKWNEYASLVSVPALGNPMEAHYLDSLRFAEFGLAEGQSELPLVDFGSGAGFPGLLFAVLAPQRLIFLCEINKKKEAFLNICKAEMNLSNVQVTARLSDCPKSALVVSRAVSSPNELISRLSSHFSSETQYCLSLSQNQKSLETMEDFEILAHRSYSLPKLQAERYAVLFRFVPRGTFSV